MKALCFGSLNIDYIYSVPHFPGKGETVSAYDRETYSGGKGLNQAITLARAGMDTWMAGAIGEDGRFLLEQLQEAGVHTESIRLRHDLSTGHAIIQRSDDHDNCIIVYGGANRTLSVDGIERTIAGFSRGDLLLVQNETNALETILRTGRGQGLLTALNPSPVDDAVLNLPLELVDILVLNRLEAEQLLGRSMPDGTEAARELVRLHPHLKVVITLGEQGCVYADAAQCIRQPAFSVQAVDTTGAGDTFTGYFLASLCQEYPVQQALAIASEAASISVTRKGAAPSVPGRNELTTLADASGNDKS